MRYLLFTCKQIDASDAHFNMAQHGHDFHLELHLLTTHINLYMPSHGNTENRYVSTMRVERRVQHFTVYTIYKN